MTRTALIVFLLLFIASVGAQIARFSERSRAARAEFEAVAADLERARADREALTTDYTYYLNPLNLEKELRARFNYRAPGETLIIIVPKQQ